MKNEKSDKQCSLYWISASPLKIFQLTAPTGKRTLIVWHCAICQSWHAEFSEQRKTIKNNE